MSPRNYQRLSIEVFGRHLITSGDLDPVYIALPKAIQDKDQRCRWLLAYWCYYHCGAASYMSEFEGQNFWNAMLTAAHNEQPAPTGGRWPRGSERRHARGAQGIKMVTDLRARYGDVPENMVYEMARAAVGGTTFSEIARLAKAHTLFGPWMSFKIGDMLERVLGCAINFDNADVFMFKDPVKAALMVWRQKMGLPPTARPKNEGAAIRDVVEYLKKEFADLRAPGGADRPIELQEVETVLCKFKSHVHGHYPLNNDIIELTTGCEGWGKTAAAFHDAMPKAVTNDQ